MAQSRWAQSDRRERLPDDWAQRRRIVEARACGQCEATMHDGTRCVAPGTDCDHIQHGDNHDYTNLQWLCGWHHRMKTSLEAREELQAVREANMPKPRKHPGLVE